jgi:hypothetical protein
MDLSYYSHDYQVLFYIDMPTFVYPLLDICEKICVTVSDKIRANLLKQTSCFSD